MISIVADLALGAFGVGLCALVYFGCIASVDGRHLSSVKRLRHAREGRRQP